MLWNNSGSYSKGQRMSVENYLPDWHEYSNTEDRTPPNFCKFWAVTMETQSDTHARTHTHRLVLDWVESPHCALRLSVSLGARWRISVPLLEDSMVGKFIITSCHHGCSCQVSPSTSPQAHGSHLTVRAATKHSKSGTLRWHLLLNVWLVTGNKICVGFFWLFNLKLGETCGEEQVAVLHWNPEERWVEISGLKLNSIVLSQTHFKGGLLSSLFLSLLLSSRCVPCGSWLPWFFITIPDIWLIPAPLNTLLITKHSSKKPAALRRNKERLNLQKNKTSFKVSSSHPSL